MIVQRKIFLLLLQLLIFVFGLKGQPSNYYFKNYQVFNGLSSNTITCILQDKKGFMWFGSRNGLNRFDGNTFRIFRNKLTDTHTIGSNSILSLFEDEKEQLWVGTYQGIYIYNSVTEDFVLFKRISPGEVRFIQGDKDHNVWIISDLVLYQYNQRSGRLTVHPVRGGRTIAIHVSSKGTLWSATDIGYVNRFDATSGNFNQYNIRSLYKEKVAPVNTLYSLGDTSVMLGTVNGVLALDLKSMRVKKLFENAHRITDIHVHTIFFRNSKEFWLGTEGGLYIYNKEFDKTTIVAKESGNPYSITDNVISSIYRDSEGGIWAGTYFGGINYYSSQYNNFHKFFPEAGRNSLSGNVVHEICKDQYGNLWIGTEDGGLNRLNLRTGHIKSFSPGNGKGSISYSNIHGLVADGNELWIGTYEHGLDVMDLRNNKVVRHYASSLKPGSFRSDFIVSLYNSKTLGILVGTWSGLFKYNRSSNSFSPLPYFSEHIQSIHEEDDGTLWVGTYGNGVYYYNFRTQRKGSLKYQAGSPGGIINNYVNSLYEDSHKNFWFCTEAGLSYYTPVSGKIKNYTTEDGLPANQIFRIAEDNAGKFWISTSKGLCRFDPGKTTFNVYHTAHGLPTEQFNYNSSFKNSDGSLFFGTVKGLIAFNPSGFVKNNFIPPVYITGLQINNKEVAINANNSPLKSSIISAKSIEVNYDDANLSIDVAALSYTIPEMNGYMYKMDGIDKNWIHIPNNRRIYYSKLPPGQYTFKVKGSNGEGIWNNHVTSLIVTVLPPLWATGWAYLVYLFMVLSIVVTIFRYYYQAITEKSKRRIETLEINKEREIYNAKIDFFTNVAHEIRTPLTLIKMPLDKLIEGRSDIRETEESLNMIKKNTNRLIDLTNQLLDFRKAEANKFSLNFSKTDINELLNEVFLTFKPAAEQKQLSYKLELPRITLHAFVDTEALKKILNNLINNAIKYAGTFVLIKLLPFSSEDVSFNIEVRNDGHLIPAEYKDKIFMPFFRLKETTRETGTGIGLPLARSLAELHKGTLELKILDQSGNIFLLTLPIHQETEIDLRGEDQEENIKYPTAGTGKSDEKDYSGKPVILIVEDNREILNYLQKELSLQYHVIKALNGQEALDMLQQENIVLVISDIMMPVLDGIELCKRMKNDIEYSHIPIILLTAKSSLNSKIEGLEVGADAYIEKPFSFEHLLAQMNSLLTNRSIVKNYFASSPLTHIKGIACSKADKDFLEHLNHVIAQHITDMDLDVDTLSEMMNMSRPTLYRKIKGLSDLTPNELINLTRLKKAAELLSEGEYKINEVANLVGYSLPTNFSRDFQRQFGISPSAYLSKLKGATN